MLPFIFINNAHNSSKFYFIKYFFSILIFILFGATQNNFVDAFCQTGCECWDELKKVECQNISTIPILFHPMLRLLSVRNSPNLKLDSVSIGLYQELEVLDLSHNNIHQIPEGFLTPLKKLRELRLRGNKLKALDTKTFAKFFHHNRHIQVLDISDNELERIDSKVFASNKLESTLKVLNLSGNHLHFINPQMTFNSLGENLRILDLSRNRFSSLGVRFFNSTPALEVLSMAGNILSELPNELFLAQSRLLHLNMSQNLISTIGDAAFSGLLSLRTLDLSNNLISKFNNFGLNDNQKYLPQLSSLQLSQNPITQIPSFAFDGLYALKELTMFDMPNLNTIQTGALAGLVSLQSLTISSCPQLTEIPTQLFTGKLTESTNQVEERRASVVLPPSKLEVLDLSANRLKSLDAAILEDWSQLKTLNLVGNSWHCDCPLLEFLPKILRNLNETATGNAVCAEPETLSNTKLSQVKIPPNCEAMAVGFDPLMTLLMLAAATLATLTTVITVIALICCCCWRYHVQQRQLNRKQRLSQSHFHDNSCVADVIAEEKKKCFKQLKVPFFRRFQPSLTKNTTGTTSSSSSSSSYCNAASSQDAHSCAQRYSSSAGTASFTESLIYEKAIPSGVNLASKPIQCYATPPLTNLPLRPPTHKKDQIPYCTDSSNFCNFNDTEYYSCILPTCHNEMAPRSKSGINLNYCIPPATNYCSQYRTYRHPPSCQPLANGKAQVLISYGNNTIAYPPYMFHSRSHYALNNDGFGDGSDCNHADNVDCEGGNCLFNESKNCGCNRGDSGCCVATTHDLLDASGLEADADNYCQPPAFIAPPPPSTIPPPPIDCGGANYNFFPQNSKLHIQTNKQCLNERV